MLAPCLLNGFGEGLPLLHQFVQLVLQALIPVEKTILSNGLIVIQEELMIDIRKLCLELLNAFFHTAEPVFQGF